MLGSPTLGGRCVAAPRTHRVRQAGLNSHALVTTALQRRHGHAHGGHHHGGGHAQGGGQAQGGGGGTAAADQQQRAAMLGLLQLMPILLILVFTFFQSGSRAARVCAIYWSYVPCFKDSAYGGAHLMHTSAATGAVSAAPSPRACGRPPAGSQSPPYSLVQESAYKVELLTQRLSIPFYVKSVPELERAYPAGSSARYRLERQVRRQQGRGRSVGVGQGVQ